MLVDTHAGIVAVFIVCLHKLVVLPILPWHQLQPTIRRFVRIIRIHLDTTAYIQQVPLVQNPLTITVLNIFLLLQDKNHIALILNTLLVLFVGGVVKHALM